MPAVVRCLQELRALLRRGLGGAAGEEERLEAMVGPPGLWREAREFQIRFLRAVGLQPHHRLLEIGCGPLRGGIPLIRYLERGRYAGIDVRPEVIEEARRQVARERLAEKDPVLAASQTFGEEELHGCRFDYVWCFQVFYHLEDELAEACLEQVARFLEPGSACYANVNADQPQGRWKEFPFLQRPLEFYAGLARAHGMAMRVVGRLHELGYRGRARGRMNHMLEFRPAPRPEQGA